MEGWKSFFLVDWFALDWSASQIRLYALCIWIFTTIWFIAGIVEPGLRGDGMLL